MKTIPIILAVVMIAASPVRGQSALDGFDPNANGAVNVVVVQPDGKILIGGSFTALSPNGGAAVTRNRIARLNPDGTLDTAFNPNASNTVWSIAVQTDGKVLVGGDFTSIGGTTRNRIARLDPATGAADSFDPNANSTVRAITVQADGQILAGGFFTSIGGQMRNRIARLDATTGLADSFDPNANGFVLAIAVQADGKILAGGQFTSIGGQSRTNVARLNATTGLADSFDPNANSAVFSIALQADGRILAGGAFTSIGGQTRNRIARLDAATGAADAFNPNANNTVVSIAVQADGKILAGGAFNGANSIGGATRNRIARLDAVTGSADAFDPNANNEVDAIAVQADGKILVSGFLTTLAPNGGAAVTRNRVARLETDGRLDQTLVDLNLSPNGQRVSATAVQPDGKILIGGIFTSVLGVTRNRIARINADGTLDSAFNPNANAELRSIAVQADGKILVGGKFTSIGGQTRSGIARLNMNGTVDLAFNPNANNFVESIAVQADCKILTCGAFTSIGGQTRNRIARLNEDGTLDTGFDPNANDDVYTIAVQADGKILAGGAFNGANSIGGQTRNRIARLDATSGSADSFDPNANSDVYTIAVQADGKILAGGLFTGIGGATRNCIARLDAITGLADSFNPNANDALFTMAVEADGKILVGGAFFGANSIGGQTRNGIARLDASTGLADSFDPNADDLVLAIALQADGKILAGGFFGFIGGQVREVFARLSNDTAALQNLAVTQTTIIWTRGGSSAQFTRVTFESSTDNVTYTFLGNGGSNGSNWSLSGLSLPTGQNLYIRARGSYPSAFLNGSESITESVRNVFLTPQPRLNIQLSAATNVVLSWGTNFTGFTLESNTNLNTNAWSSVSPAPSVSGTNNVVTNATTEAQKFYRLFKP